LCSYYTSPESGNTLIRLHNIRFSKILNQGKFHFKIYIVNGIEGKDSWRCACHKYCIIFRYCVRCHTLHTDFNIIFRTYLKYVFSGNTAKHHIVRCCNQCILPEKKDIGPASFSNLHEPGIVYRAYRRNIAAHPHQ